MILKRSMKLGLAVAAALGFASSANASLTLIAPEDFSGTGLGGVNTILTIQSPGSSSFENGSVSWNGTADVISGSNVLTGASQTLTRTLTQLGITTAASLRVVFNASEPGGNGINLDTMALTIYNANGTTFFTAPLDHAYTFANTQTGIGNSGFVFGLNAQETGQLQSLLNPLNGNFSNLRAGLSASASDATGGNETFFIANSAGLPTTAVPEPESYAMMLAGLGLLGFIVGRRNRRQT